MIDQRRGRLFDDLLVPPLDRTVTLPQMNDAAFVIAKNLEFDVVRIFDEFLDIDA